MFQILRCPACARIRLCAVTAAIVCVGTIVPSAFAAISIVNIGVLSGDGYSQAVGVSRDGSVAVGVSGNHAIRWTAAGGAQDLGVLAGETSAAAVAANGDGSVVVGYCDGPAGRRSFRWTAGTGMQDIGTLSGVNGGASAVGVSADGNTVVGQVGSPGVGFIWTPSGGMHAYHPGSPSQGNSAETRGVSADGTVLVGIGGGPVGAFRLSLPLPGTTTQLQAFSGGYGSSPFGVSGNGQVAVGQAANSSGTFEAARWSSAGAIQGLGLINGRPTNALATSFDGSVVVGNVFGGNPNGQDEAFIWTQTLGMLDLRSYLNSVGVGTRGWELDDVFAISDGGDTIAGSGLFNGLPRAFVVTIPTPAAGGTFIALLLCTKRRTRRV
jgi:probable HAF family extracellular repeat protein